MATIAKIPSMVAFPLSKNSNQLYFDISDDGGQIDMASSYVELEVSIPQIAGANYKNVVLGRSGIQYNPSCFFRTAKLFQPRTQKTLQDLTYVNLLSQNLTYYSQGCNEVDANGLWSGAGQASNDVTSGDVLSVFNNTYSDSTAVIKCPLSLLFPGSLGASDQLPMNGSDLRAYFLLEPQYKLFQRAIMSGLYDVTGTDVGTSYNFGGGDAGATVFTAGAEGIVANFTVDQLVSVSYVDTDVTYVVVRQIKAIAPDAGGNAGTVTLNTALSANAVTVVTITTLVNNNAGIPCVNVATTTDVVGCPQSNSFDLYVGTTVNITASIFNFVTSVVTPFVPANPYTITQITAGDPTEVTLSSELVVPADSILYNVTMTPLYTNLDNDWSLVNSHLVLYRRKDPSANQAKMLLSTFNSVNFAMLGGLSRFMYSIKAPVNTYNCYALTPDQENMVSVKSTLSEYRVYVDDKPLTSIYVPIEGSAIYYDNLIRVLENSSEYSAKNLQKNRDYKIQSNIEPYIYTGKLFHNMVRNEPNVQNFDIPDINIKLELIAGTGTTGTPQTNVYLFTEQYVLV